MAHTNNSTANHFAPQYAAQFSWMDSDSTPPTISSPNADCTDESNPKRKRRLEVKNKSETKRREKFNDKLNALKSLLECEAEDGKTLTRDQVMMKAIQEIQRLKKLQHNPHETKLESTSTPNTCASPVQYTVCGNKKSLNDPFNRYPWTPEDMDTVFQVLYLREFSTVFRLNRNRTSEVFYSNIKYLLDIAEQTGKSEHKLYVSMLEQVFHSRIVPNAIEFKRVLDKNLALYNQVKTEKDVQEVIFARGELSNFLFGDFSLYHSMTGNTAEAERIWQFTFKLSQQNNSAALPKNFLFIGVPYINYFRRHIKSMDYALQLKELMRLDVTSREMSKLMMAQIYAKQEQYEQALKYVEDGIAQFLDCWGDMADVLLGPILVDVLITVGKLDQALTVVNHLLKKGEEALVEGFASKAESLRLKAKILYMKLKQQMNSKMQTANQIKPASTQLTDLVNVAATLFPADNNNVNLHLDELEQTLLTNNNSISQIETQLANQEPADLVQIELLLQYASEVAKQRGILLVELRCAVDAAEVWLECGDDMQKLQALNTLEAVCEQVKGQDTDEYQTAQKLIVELRTHIAALFPPNLGQTVL